MNWLQILIQISTCAAMIRASEIVILSKPVRWDLADAARRVMVTHFEPSYFYLLGCR